MSDKKCHLNGVMLIQFIFPKWNRNVGGLVLNVIKDFEAGWVGKEKA